MSSFLGFGNRDNLATCFLLEWLFTSFSIALDILLGQRGHDGSGNDTSKELQPIEDLV